MNAPLTLIRTSPGCEWVSDVSLREGMYALARASSSEMSIAESSITSSACDFADIMVARGRYGRGLRPIGVRGGKCL